MCKLSAEIPKLVARSGAVMSSTHRDGGGLECFARPCQNTAGILSYTPTGPRLSGVGSQQGPTNDYKGEAYHGFLGANEGRPCLHHFLGCGVPRSYMKGANLYAALLKRGQLIPNRKLLRIRELIHLPFFISCCVRSL